MEQSNHAAVESLKDYLKKVCASLHYHFDQKWAIDNTTRRSIYDGKQGCLRLAREVGGVFSDHPQEVWKRVINESYTEICVKGYHLSPPVDADEWVAEIRKSIERCTAKA